MQYCRNGNVIRESSQSTKESVAKRLLKRRLGEIQIGLPVGPDVNRTTFQDMAIMLTDDYKANGYRSLDRVEDAINHLKAFFVIIVRWRLLVTE